MVERRCINKKITESDAFLEMPLSSQCLYFHLVMNVADDDGFVNAPKKIQRMIGASDDDLKLLIAKSFIIPFESGVIVIKHWWMHNIQRKDRYHETAYTEEKALLSVKENGSYTLNGNQMTTNGLPNDNQMESVSNRNKININNKRENREKNTQENYDFLSNIPTLEEIKDYITLKDFHFDAQRFKDYYDSIDWKRGSSPITNWQALCGIWEQKIVKEQNPKRDYEERNYTREELQSIVTPIDLITEDMI